MNTNSLQEHIKKVLREDKKTKSTNKEFSKYKDSKFNSLRDYTLQDIVDNWESLSDHKNENIKTIRHFINNPDKITDLVYDDKGLEDGYHRLIAAKILKKPRFTYRLVENLQESIKKVLREEVGLIDRLRKLFPKKELTTEEKRIDLIVRYLIPMFKLQSHKNINSEGHKTISIISFNSDGNSTVMKYYPEFKRLEYKWGFAEKIHKMFPHKDLLHLDSEMIGQLFTRLYKKKVDRVEGYRYLS